MDKNPNCTIFKKKPDLKENKTYSQFPHCNIIKYTQKQCRAGGNNKTIQNKSKQPQHLIKTKLYKSLRYDL